MLFLTLRFIDTGTPSSYSTPDAPPSPAISDIFARSSSSSSAGVLWWRFVVGEGAVDVFVRDVATESASVVGGDDVAFEGDKDGDAGDDVVDEGGFGAGLECAGGSEEKSEAKENVRDVGVGRVRGADAKECSGRARLTSLVRTVILCSRLHFLFVCLVQQEQV